MTLPPCLIVDAIQVCDGEVVADLRLGPRHERVVIGLSIPYFVEFKKLPQAIDSSLRAQRALLDVMEQVCGGETVSLPLDLSNHMFSYELTRWPLALRFGADPEDPRMNIEVVRIERPIPDKDGATVHLKVLDVPTVVAVAYEGDEGGFTVMFRFISGVHPWQLTDIEAWAMLKVLLRASQRANAGLPAV